MANDHQYLLSDWAVQRSWPWVKPDWTSSSRSGTSRGSLDLSAGCPDPHTPQSHTWGRWHTGLTDRNKKKRRHFQSLSCSESYSPVQIVGKCRVLASTGDEEGAQVLLQRDTIDNLSMWHVRISIVSNCFFLFKTVFFSVTFSVSYLKILAVGSFLAFLRCRRGSRCARQDLGTTERDNH